MSSRRHFDRDVTDRIRVWLVITLIMTMIVVMAVPMGVFGFDPSKSRR